MQGSGWRVDLLYIEDPTVALCLGTFGGSMGVGLSYERGTPVLLVSGSFHAGKRVTRADADLLYIETLHNVAKVLSYTIYQLDYFRKSTHPQNRQLVVSIFNSK